MRALRWSPVFPALMLLAVCLAAPSLAAETKNVLNLNSYHEGFEWSEGIVRGLKSGLGGQADLSVEYMDTKRFYSEAYTDMLRELYAFKYKDNGVDLVVASDDNAFRFALEHRGTIFAGIPLVFCGVNDFDPAMIEGVPDVTGVTESIDHREIIELALELVPEAGMVYVITDATTSGLAHYQQVRAIEKQLDAGFSYIADRGGMTADELLRFVGGIPRDAVVYYSHFFKDAAGEYVEHKEYLPALSENCPAPVFVNSPLYVGHGPVGGYVVSPLFQGKEAARLAGRILAGEAPAEAPLVMKSPNRYLFDHRQLQRFGLDRSALPQGSTVLHKPSSFYSKHRTAIISVILVIAALTLIIVLLIMAIIRNRSAHRTLLRAKKASEEASRTKTEFLANMSHEIRTPLNGILGMLQLLQTTELSEEQKEYTLTAIHSSDRLTRLLSDILDLSRVEVGKIAIHSEPFDPGRTLDQVADLFRPTARQTGVDLQTRIDPNLPGTVFGDEARLHQVISNLVGNAFKFTTSGSVTIEASSLPDARPDRDTVLFSVSDTGIGIPDEKLDMLFEPFTQASEGFRRRYQGAGLGLSICKRLVDLMGGSIAVVSEEGLGTTFYFSIPFAATEARAPEAGPSAEIETDELTLKTLLAEDDEVSVMLMKKLLEKAGCEVMVAANGQQVLDALPNGEFDLVFMDVQMPVMDGVEATRAIRNGEAGEGNKDMPVIALTAYAMAGDKETFLQAGMDGYLSKPVDMDDLLEVLNQYNGR
jgi:signal transduction histidine kinase/ActR/RegA family two-component response regulator